MLRVRVRQTSLHQPEGGAAARGTENAVSSVAYDARQVDYLWPEEIAGRRLRALTADTAVYALDAAAAEELRAWLEAELALFRSRYQCTIGRGIVISVDSREDPNEAVEAWHTVNVRRDRRIHWTSSIRNQTFVSDSGRPYTFVDPWYFREGFSMPMHVATEIGIMAGNLNEPTWLCFLPSEEYYNMCFQEKHTKAKAEVERAMKTASPDQALYGALLGIAARIAIPVYRSIFRSMDADLMRLQRREMLWQELLNSSDLPEARRTAEIEAVRSEIDEEWKSTYFRRPRG
jgi:hypothetical protein